MNLAALFLIANSAAPMQALDDGPKLMRTPTVNATHVVFAFAGDLWSVPRAGGDAVRITSSPGIEANPRFSPDGNWLAFDGTLDGNRDAFVMAAGGGVPKRLTYHPGPDFVNGWTNDGKRVLISSSMLTENVVPRLFTVPTGGGAAEALPLPEGSYGSYSPDGTKIAYSPGIQWQDAWKRYRGGQTMPVWIAQLSDSKVTEIPRNNTNDTFPMWIGDKIYFLSDRTDGKVTLWSYDVASKKTSRLIVNNSFDMKSASHTGTTIALERLGEIMLYDTGTNKASTVPITIRGDFGEIREQYKNTAQGISSADISPSGARVVFEARGDIYTVPAAKGDVRNMTQTSGVAERYPTWSPDGKSIAYYSDAGGEYKLVIRNADGGGTPKSFTLGESPGYYYQAAWSPDSKKLVYTDNKHNIWWLDAETGASTKVDTWPYENPIGTTQPRWSPDSKWITYSRDLDHRVNAVFLYNIDTKKVSQVTDGLSDAKFPVFDKNGRYLYFVASTNTARGSAWLDLSSYMSLNSTASVYCVVLRNDLPSPLEPESDEEKTGEAPKEEKKADFRIDLDGLDQRILALPMQTLNYGGLTAGPNGTFFAVSLSTLATPASPPIVSLQKFDMNTRTGSPFASNIQGFAVSGDGSKMVLAQGGTWSIVPTAAPPQPGQGALRVQEMQAKVDPKAEWKQMYREVWRIQRDFLYAPNFHGINIQEMEKRYEPFLANIMSRDDLNYLFSDMLGELCIGHMFIFGGDIPGTQGVPGGLLGADYRIANGRYQFARVYNGENWNPSLRAPLTQPGINVKAGEYLLAVNGKDLRGDEDIYARFEATAGKQVKIKVGPNPNDVGSREVTVVPTGNEAGLRHLAWVEDCRRTVDRLSNGKVGYAHIPDTNVGGWTNFNRYYYAQLGKEGMVIDERFNGGGFVDDYMVESMNRPLRSFWTARYGKDFASPASAIFGPKVMIVNQYAGSGGDYFPWHFRQAKTGSIVGKRTWGGLVGILIFPNLIDGGGVTAPNIAFWNPNGTWEIENWGVAPDIDVELDPYLWRQGRDAQLERAVAEVLKAIEKQPKKTYTKPAYPDKTKAGG